MQWLLLQTTGSDTITDFTSVTIAITINTVKRARLCYFRATVHATAGAAVTNSSTDT